MAITYVGATTALTATTKIDTSITCTTPSSTVNDVLIAWIDAVESTASVNPVLTAQDADWIQIGTVADSGTPTPYSSLWYRIVKSGDDTTPTWTSTGGVTFLGAMVMVAYRGVDLTTPIATSAFDVISAATTARTSASITTSLAQWIVSGFADKTAGVAYSSASGSLRGQTRQPTSGIPTVMIQDSNGTVAAGTITQTAVGASTSVGNSFTLALKANRDIMPTGQAETFTGSNGATPNSTNISTPTKLAGSGGGLSIQGNQLRMRSGTTSGNRISWRINTATTLADAEVVFDWVVPADNALFPAMYARTGGLVDGDGGFYIALGRDAVVVGKWVPDYSGVDMATQSYAFAVGNIVRTRIAIFGARIRSRSWLASNSEPTSTWDIDVTATGTYPTIGYWGFTHSSGSSGSKDWFLDNIDLLDSITPSQATLSVGGTITATGAFKKNVTKSFAGSITASGVFNKLKVVPKIFTGSITATGAFKKNVTKSFTASITPSGAFKKNVVKRLAGTITAAGAFRKNIRKTFSGTVTATGATEITFIGRVFGYPGILVMKIRKVGDLRVRFRRG
jgi:cytoskeletal protein CcmA (bactofilin family)